ncbi:MAG: hypothetical protein K0Q72_1892 [Armatimonadetes bacterium]|jgi:hypothetical protein|nr:hypothetical protein [Armatimonadota bacterium]
MRTVYIQSREDGEFPGTGFYASWHGFTALSYSVRKFAVPDLPDLDLSPATVVCGSVRTVRTALTRLGIPIPAELNIPPGTEPFLGRSVGRSTLGEVRKLQRVPLFVKPFDQGKIFTGHVVSGFGDLLQTVNLADDTPVLVQDPVEFRSEWRAFVLRCKVVGIGHYKGDPLLFPDPAVIQGLIAAYEDPFIAHSVDVGIDGQGRTQLVEMNDAYALGDYGLPSVTYARMIEARWDEMCGG